MPAISLSSKFSRFKSQYDKSCMGLCGRLIQKGDTVYGTKEKPLSPKGRWFIVCPDCFKRLSETSEAADASSDIRADEYHLAEGGDTTMGSEAAEGTKATMEGSTDLLRELISVEAEREKAMAQEREQKRQAKREAAMKAKQEREARKNIPWTPEWLWENAEWRWNRGAAVCEGE